MRASLDDFKRPWSERHLYDRTSAQGFYRNAHDFDAVRRLLLEPAAPTGSGLVSLCNIDPLTQINHADERVVIPEGGVMIVDTVFAFRRELVDYWELGIRVEVDAELSVQRGVEGDAPRKGVAATEAVHRERYGAAEEIYVREVDPVAKADVVVDNTDFDNPRLTKI
jgi:uridine kinase